MHICAPRAMGDTSVFRLEKGLHMSASPTPGGPADCEIRSTNNRLADRSALEDARGYFSQDLFATERCGAQIEEAAPGRAVCSFEILPHHRNAMGAVMGGAIFTLADFALAVASNFSQPPSVTVSSSAEFIASPRGARLIATCEQDRSGRRIGFYTTRVADDTGALVALVQATCMRV